MPWKARPCIREDGKTYPSAYQAARELLREVGGKGTLDELSSQISKACNHYKGAKTCLGHHYEYMDSPVVSMLLGRVTRRDIEIGHLSARLEMANDRLREHGLEQE